MDKTKFEWLAARTADKAVEYLEAIQQRATMLQLYQYYYPDEYQQSKASVKVTSLETYSEKELEFLTLLGEQFFPLPLLLAESERISYIPVEPLGTSWYYDNFEELGATEKFLMSLIHGLDGDTWNDIEGELEQDLPPVASYINYPKLSQEAQKVRGMIALLPTAIDMLTQSTGNLWLDISYENDIVDAHWTVEVIDTLREAYTEAQTIMQKYREFIEWLDKDSANCIKVVRLWNRCKETNPEIHNHYLVA
ncbi:hypothetical protein [Phormidium tenue]|uniref:Uncharacterized protein n=1 Tax=Phormidium tenue FACHB-1050 TaxID=2692857 RepID=A0ABR8C8B0_9CYAN|nr:hypothetical protein [Phormidium tenue]MBD2316320.1 hypothetical protein [Phormidium tenue FACHB-1050]